MAAVTIDAAAQNSYYSAGNVGWSARSIFAYRTAIQQLSASTVSNLGETTTNAMQAQSFTPGANIDVNEVRVSILKVGTPADNVSCDIYSDTGANKPNASIQAADNVYAGGAISTSSSWLTFQFATPVSLTSGTKYWIVLQRSGAVDASNFYRWNISTASSYAGGGSNQFNSGTGLWGTESSTSDYTFQILTETPSALYAVTQSTTPELHVWKSTDSGATWTEQDTANNPSVTNANYPFSACDTRSGPYLGLARFTNTNTIRAAIFDMSTDLWGTDLGAADATTAASNERSIRMALDHTFITASHGSQVVSYTSSADDADLHHTRRATAGWTAGNTILSINSTSASLVSDVVVDKAPIGFQHRLYYDVVNNDFSMRTLITTTGGTEADIVTDAADVETEHASATYQIYQASNVDRIVAAFINADGSIQERTATLEVTSASVTLGTEHAVGTATTTAGRQLSTCEYGGDLYVLANVSGTGLTYYIDAGAAGSWDSGTAWKSGLTACTLSQIINVPGIGLGVVYTDNGDVKIDWIDGGPASDVTINGSLATATAAAISALIKPTIQGSLSTSDAAALVGSIVYDINGSLATATALANDGVVYAPQTVNGSLATGDGAANIGTIVIDIPGSLSTADGAANAGALIAALTGSVAAADGAAYSGALDFTFAGSLATADAAALDGALAVVIVGTTSLADAVANDGDVLLGYTVLGSLATASAQANDGTASETGAGDDEPRSGIFQLRPLVAVEA
jgi:hypothetical protein